MQVWGPRWCAVVLVGIGLLGASGLAACGGDEPAVPTRGSTFPAVAPPQGFTEIPAPPGAITNDGADHWYRAPAADGRAVELAVYLPETPVSSPTPTVLVLHGADGLRRNHEVLAREYAKAGFIGIAGCWFDQPEAPLITGAVSCSGGPTFKGTEAGAVADVDAVVAGVGNLPDVDLSRLAIVGHSYGGSIALMRAADTGSTDPVVAVSALLAATPTNYPARKGDRFPLDHAAAIRGPVLLLHANGDRIAPIGQARAFVAARPETEVVEFPAPAVHAFPWQTDQYPGAAPGTTVQAQFLADSVGWLRARFP